ncbi:putative 2-oxodicarboxylate carrier [Fonsecaea pedrosoi]|nr:putative 2-oxodicarboxylate carrier [Fonsecaea pedrosoi]
MSAVKLTPVPVVDGEATTAAAPVSVPAPQIKEKQATVPFRYQFLAGAVAGVSEVLVMYAKKTTFPFWGVSSGCYQNEINSASRQYTGMIDCGRKILYQEGIPVFYRAIGAPILMEAPKRATKFASNAAFGSFYQKLFGQEKMTQPLSIVTGASAGVAESFVICPFEVVKLRMQNPANASQYKNVVDCVGKLARNEGLSVFFQGFECTMWRSVVWNAAYFGCIFQIRALLPKADTKAGQMTNDLIAGSLGGTAGIFVNTPFDVVKSRIQSVATSTHQVRKYNWAFPALATVIREEGVSALYKGLVPKLARFCPGGGILLVTYTTVIDFLTTMNNKTRS